MKFTSFALTCAIALVAVSTGCDKSSTTTDGGSDSAAPAAESTLVGTIKIDGSSTVQPISNAIREGFIQEHPNVDINVSGNGTGNGFKSFYDKGTDISDASRPIKAGEFEKCKENGVEFVELPVAYDGLTIVVNPQNDWVKELTVDQLKSMFVGDDAVKNWSDVDPSWPEEAIQIYAPGTGSGTYDYFHEVLAKKSGKELRGDMNLNEDDNILVKGVADNKFSIGFFGVAYYAENTDKLRAVPIVNPKDETAYEPTTENIASNKYAPFSRPLFIYVNTESLNRAEVQTFVEYFLANTPEVSEKVGYVRLPESVMAKAQSNLDAVSVGTHFVDESGEGRSGALTDLYKDENLVK
ncbi:PstS family phosphate ABC transporter substrate-binding protein [Rhodopirellula sp. JC740]|uniref:Phosphate-binding protein n=1 Tax=Rhodopirellula halodulae TaxID=2894198 RepID=A0ABS8NE13_9BACT|nr:PstS family phosphate ABC transporter substrate-binding protein [Rhodopirellula sp. JC740]MCC9641167.1 PstS family phosphate ABC transporter substrate-binding protein [Rhodopirellula sp. JC740]